MSMLLKGNDGKEFELAVIPDRVAEAQDGFGDDEAATVAFRVATEDQQWEETSPSLGIYELQTLAEWLDSVAGGDPSEPEIDLLEPELNFQVLRQSADEVSLRIRFHLHERPEQFEM